jgi:large subunit ribosomal protein L17
MVTQLFHVGYMRTTLDKGKILKGLVDRLITIAKKGDLTAKRKLQAVIRSEKIVQQVLNDAKSLYGDRNSGYSVVVRIGLRAGDKATMCYIRLIPSEGFTAAADYARSGKTSKLADRARRVAASRASQAAKATEAPAAEPAAPETPASEAQAPAATATEAPAAEPAAPEAPASEAQAPVATATEAPAAEPAASETPETATAEATPTEAPATEPEAPTSDPEAPATEPGGKPDGGDNQ